MWLALQNIYPFSSRFASRAFSACVRYKEVSHNGVLNPLFTRIRVFTSWKLSRVFFFYSPPFSTLCIAPSTPLPSATRNPFCIRSHTLGSKCCRSCSRFSRNDAAYIPHRRIGFSHAATLRNDPTISNREIFAALHSHRAANRFYRILLKEPRESVVARKDILQIKTEVAKSTRSERSAKFIVPLSSIHRDICWLN